MITVDDINTIIRRETTPEMLQFLVRTRNNWPPGSLMFGPISVDVVFDATLIDVMSKHVEPARLYNMMINVDHVDMDLIVSFVSGHIDVLSSYYMYDVVIMRRLGIGQRSPIVVTRSKYNTRAEATLYFGRDCTCMYDYDASTLCKEYEKHRHFVDTHELPYELMCIKNTFDDSVDIAAPMCALADVPDWRIKQLMSIRPDVLMILIRDSKDPIETLIERFKQIDTRIEQYYGILYPEAVSVLTVTGQLCLNPYMAYRIGSCKEDVTDEIDALFEKYPALRLNYVPTLVSRNTSYASFLKYCPVYRTSGGFVLPPVDTMLDDPKNMTDEMRDAVRQMHAQIDTYGVVDSLVPRILKLYAYV